jgi:hypothetical protein
MDNFLGVTIFFATIDYSFARSVPGSENRFEVTCVSLGFYFPWYLAVKFVFSQLTIANQGLINRLSNFGFFEDFQT